LLPKTADDGYKALTEHGCALLRGCSRKRQSTRCMASISRSTAPLTRRRWRLGQVVSYPGSDRQHIHRDHPLLFGDCEESCNLPSYAINVTVPLIDVSAEMGPTGVWLGSHRHFEGGDPHPRDMTMAPFRRGDCVLLDYRVMHAGLPNKSNVVRPIAYLVYTKTWFFDEMNHVKRSPLGMTLAQYNAMPEELQPLLLRAFSQHMRAQHVSGLASSTS
jgi:ectoine hydroxylase-related dioxygenase (phytanoyl-CoA dioxygenase family)